MKPSPRQLTTLRLVAASLRTKGVPPTVRELGTSLGLASTNGVACLLRGLVRKGYLQKDPMKSRALQITEAGQDVLNHGGGTGAVQVPSRCFNDDCAAVYFTPSCPLCVKGKSQ